MANDDFTPDDLLGAMIDCANHTYENPANFHSGKRGFHTKAEYRVHSEQYRNRHPERIKARSMNSRTKSVASSGNAKAIAEIYEHMEGRCGYCGMSVFWDIPKDVHVDHITPLALGGSNNPANLIIACQKCNNSKFDKSLEQWIKDRGW